MFSKNKYLYITIGILIIFTIVYFVSANRISYSFVYDAKESSYEAKLNYINIAAKTYATKNPDLFKEKDILYLSVNDLIEAKYLLADEDGNLKDPRSEVKTLNDLKLRITKNNDTFEVKVLE